MMRGLAKERGILARTVDDTADPVRRHLYLDRNMLVIFTITLVALVGVSSIAPALPAVSRRFDITAAHVGWLVSVFTIPGIVFTPLMGLAGDRLGRKRVLVPSLILFALAGGACTLVDDFSLLLVLRFLQGVGAAAIGALNLALISDLYRGQERIAAFGYNTAAISTAAAGYPLLGGLLVLLGWQYPFVLALLGLPVAALVVLVLDNPPSGRAQPLGVYFRNLAAALRRLDLAVLFLSSLAVFIMIYGTLITFLPFLVERGLGGTAVDYGAVMAANAVGSVVGSVALGSLASRQVPPRAIALTALPVLAATTAALPFAHALWAMIVISVLLGIAMGLFLALVQSMVANRAPDEQRGAVIALNGMMIRTGQTLGPVLMALLLTVGGMIVVFVGGAAIVLAMAPLIAVALRPRET
jgi:ACDE family multidrug resistance protein